jgi:predicted nucleic acid-binding protein
MRYVLDSCVAVKWFLAEPDSAKAIQVLDEFSRQIHELLAPDVFPIEVAHALSRAERRALIQPPAGSQHLSDLLAFLPALHTSLTLLPRA